MMKQRLVVVLAAVILASSTAGLVVSNVGATVTQQQQASLITILSADNDALRDQVDSLGQKPVAPPAQDRADESETTTAVGPAGRDGANATSEQIMRELVRYCNVHECRGADSIVSGPIGLPGADGADSSAPGPPGAPGSNGTDGTDGADSTVPGPAGVGITDVACVQLDITTTAFRFTFTDSSTRDVQGPCTPAASPIPEETP